MTGQPGELALNRPITTVAAAVSVRTQAPGGISAFGVYPVLAQLQDSSGDLLAAGQTLLPFWPGRQAAGLLQPLNISWLWPLIDQPHHQVCTALTNNGSLTVEVHALGQASTCAAWSLHSASAFGTVAASDWQFRIGDRAGSGDLIGIGHAATGSGRTEVHAVSRASGYQGWTLHAATPLQYTSDNQFSYVLGDEDMDGIPDIFAVAMNSTGSGMTEVHVLSGASGYNNWLDHAATGLQPTNQTSWQFSVR